MLQARDGGGMFMALGQGLLAPGNCLWVEEEEEEEACRGLQGSAPPRPPLWGRRDAAAPGKPHCAQCFDGFLGFCWGEEAGCGGGILGFCRGEEAGCGGGLSMYVQIRDFQLRDSYISRVSAKQRDRRNPCLGGASPVLSCASFALGHLRKRRPALRHFGVTMKGTCCYQLPCTWALRERQPALGALLWKGPAFRAFAWETTCTCVLCFKVPLS